MRLGTRGSRLALAQARWVADRLAGEVELVEITTAGEDPRDVLVGVPSLDALPEGARVGTSALRRRAQLLAVRPDLDVVDLRGNVDTRLRRLADGEVDALVLAAAGLARLGRDDVATAAPAGPVFVPAPGQGALLVQARVGDDRAAAVDDAGARAAVTAERRVAARLGASCRTAIGVFDDGAALRAFAGLPDGSEWLVDELPSGGADALAERLLATGAADLLARAEAMVA